ncbi:MAG: porin family protein [Dysgonamonadaceae bacterium]|jgi:outer membrane protein X|nr:porin family protein [Dysgonamonadaceae bacterium]
MRKIVFLIAALFVVLSASAQMSVSEQKKEKSIGFSLNYGTEIESLGIGGHFTYNLTDHLRLAPDFTYFFKNNNLNEWDLNINGHYLFPLDDSKVTVYPIFGFIITHWSHGDKVNLGNYTFSASETKFGINLGGGIQYDLTGKMFFKSELKYCIVSDFDQAVVSVGLGFRF